MLRRIFDFLLIFCNVLVEISRNSVVLADNFPNVKMSCSQHCHLIDMFDAGDSATNVLRKCLRYLITVNIN